MFEMATTGKDLRRIRRIAPAKRKINAWDRQFGDRLKIAREGAQLSQQQMADALRMPVDTYQKYEHGRRSFPKHRIAEIIKITHHGPWFMLTGEPDSRCPAYGGQPPHTPR